MASVILNSGEEVVIRRLEPGDAAALLRYFDNFSDLTRKRFGPHPFDEATVNAICNGLASDSCVRLVAIAGERCLAYCLLQPGILDHDADRLRSYGLNPDQFRFATYAPSVDEHYHGTGLAGAMLQHLEGEAKKTGATHVILWGGVQHGNPRAVRFYEKNGFVKVGTFNQNGGDDDMIKALN